MQHGLVSENNHLPQLFYFDTVQTINSISISYNENVQSYLMPPAEVEVWARRKQRQIKIIKEGNCTTANKRRKEYC